MPVPQPLHALDRSIPLTRRIGCRGCDDVVTQPTSRNAVKRRASVIALAVLLALAGCGPESTKTVPDDLIGVWKTSAPKYADTFIELTRTTIAFGAGEKGTHLRSVVKVTKEPEAGGPLYTVFYRDPEGQEYKFAFYYDPADSVLRWKNQRTIAWMKATR